MSTRGFLGALVAACLAGGALAAPPALRAPSEIDPEVMRIDELKHLGTPLPRELALVDEQGRALTLGELLGKPVILLLSYYGCDGTCPTMNTQLRDTLAQVGRFRIGADYRVLTVSFDRNDDVEAAARFAGHAGIPAAMREGWRHAVLANREADIERLAGSVGFRYFWSRADQVFLHPNVLIFLTPEGRVARYLYGTTMDRRDVELALVEADWNRIANSARVIDMLAGVCFSYNYAEGKYGFNISLAVGAASLLFGIGLVVLSALLYRNRIARRNTHAQQA
jgi:protein SCO1/2